MTLQKKIDLLNNLKTKYYDGLPDSDLEKLRNKFEKLQLSEVDFIYDESHKDGQLFICPDLEWEFPEVYEIAEEIMIDATLVIYDAIALYYKESNFWDAVTGLTPNELVKIYTRLHNIPIIRYFSVKDVELLNVRQLNSDVR